MVSALCEQERGSEKTHSLSQKLKWATATKVRRRRSREDGGVRVNVCFATSSASCFELADDTSSAYHKVNTR